MRRLWCGSAEWCRRALQRCGSGAAQQPPLPRSRRCQAETGGEQPLNHMVVQVAGDAVSILQDTESLLVGSGVAEF